MIPLGERLRVKLFGVMLLAGAAAIAGRLAQLQVGRTAECRAAVSRQRHRVEPLPAPRGAVLDRAGRLLAHDRPVFEVRAEWQALVPAAAPPGVPPAAASALAAQLAAALAADADRQGDPRFEPKAARLLEQRIGSARTNPERDQPMRRVADGQSERALRKVDFLVDPKVDSADVEERLRTLDRRDDRLTLHFSLRYERVYPDRLATIGPVGFLGEMQLANGAGAIVRRGLECLQGLMPGDLGLRLVEVAARTRQYWTGIEVAPERASVLTTTLDLELQKAAQHELEAAVALVRERYAGTPPEWGAMILLDVESGGVLAMASFSAKADPWSAAFAPTQNLISPGSVVKPLLFAVALECGALEWDGPPIDCHSSGPTHVWQHGPRPIRDDHACGVLSPQQILVQSSNIGAAKVGQRLGRRDLQHYIDVFGFGRTTGLGFAGEKAGKAPHDIATRSERDFRYYVGPSVCYGYEMNVTPLQVARAFLSLLSRHPRELRLCDSYEIDGAVHRVPVKELAAAKELISVANLARLKEAMREVVSDSPQATGRYLHEELRQLGLGTGLIGGKTGTSEYTEQRQNASGVREGVMVRTASFCGFAPIEAPRFVVLCVLQKDRASKFYGGQYAAPAAGRLLLRALAQETGRFGSPGQVSASGTNRRAVATAERGGGGAEVAGSGAPSGSRR